MKNFVSLRNFMDFSVNFSVYLDILEGRVGLKCLKLCLGSLVVESSAILLHSVVGHFYI